jgi:pimeloyl-ACP methyl ester carboxylesterase
MLAWLRDLTRGNAGTMLALVQQDVARDQPGGFMQAARFLAGDDTPPRGSGLTMPLLMIQGEEDRVTPAAANAELLARAVPDAKLLMFASCGHLPGVEAPARVNELIERHLCACSKT